MPTIIPPVAYETFRERVIAGEAALFTWLDNFARRAQVQELQDLCATWFDLLTTDVIQRWLLSSCWAKPARENGDPALHPVLGLLLRRHLRHLGTRRDASKLSQFWSWATAMEPDFADPFERHAAELRNSLTSPTSEPILESESESPRIANEEAAFVGWLDLVSRSLADDSRKSPLAWAANVVSRLLDERRLPALGRRATQATVRVVFAMHDRHELLRPGIVVTFRLLSNADQQSFLQHANVFDASF